MPTQHIPPPYSAGVFLTYRCNCACHHCMYCCSPRWENEWLSLDDAACILDQLERLLADRYPPNAPVSLNSGVHFTGGEPLLDMDRLLAVIEMAAERELPGLFVETNGFWATDDARACETVDALWGAGLRGMLLSANPFSIERVPFERIERAAMVGQGRFGQGMMVYQPDFFRQFQSMGLRGTLDFADYARDHPRGLAHVELLPNGRVPYSPLAGLFEHWPAEHFGGENCRRDILRDWHMHIDPMANYLPGYCGGLALGDARDLTGLCGNDGYGIDLEAQPILAALLTDMADLVDLARAYGWQEDPRGYLSKCHLCLAIRRYLVVSDSFIELAPLEFYDHIED